MHQFQSHFPARSLDDNHAPIWHAIYSSSSFTLPCTINCPNDATPPRPSEGKRGTLFLNPGPLFIAHYPHKLGLIIALFRNSFRINIAMFAQYNCSLKLKVSKTSKFLIYESLTWAAECSDYTMVWEGRALLTHNGCPPPPPQLHCQSERSATHGH